MTSTTSTQTRTETEPIRLLSLRGSAPRPIDEIASEASKETSYKYARYLPSQEGDGIHYPPLTDFEHVDPGLEALKHENAQEFLESATVTAVCHGAYTLTREDANVCVAHSKVRLRN